MQRHAATTGVRENHIGSLADEALDKYISPVQRLRGIGNWLTGGNSRHDQNSSNKQEFRDKFPATNGARRPASHQPYSTDAIAEIRVFFSWFSRFSAERFAEYHTWHDFTDQTRQRKIDA